MSNSRELALRAHSLALRNVNNPVIWQRAIRLWATFVTRMMAERLAENMMDVLWYGGRRNGKSFAEKVLVGRPEPVLMKREGHCRIVLDEHESLAHLKGLLHRPISTVSPPVRKHWTELNTTWKGKKPK